jgi:pantoate--beta-alanine ligase
MQLAQTIADCRAKRATLGKLALVPTMGALHEGHLRLFETAHEHAERVAVSLFVNPTQFGPREDFSKYPRPLEQDLELCRRAEVDLVFHPLPAEMYPEGGGESGGGGLTFRTADKSGAVAPESPPAGVLVDLPQLSGVLEGRFRPGHFQGVCQVVAKLFNIIQPDAALFGQKDYQQLLILTRLAEELNFPVRIIACPTVRDGDGLALSSRNQYLSPPERQRALAISRGLFAAEKEFTAGLRQANRLVTTVQNILLDGGAAGQIPLSIDYVAAVDARTLRNVQTIDRPAVLAVAARVGKTRLIDNVILRP